MSLTIVEPSIEERIQRQIDSGRFADASEVMTKALDVLENEQKLRVLRELIDEADESVARGEVYEKTPTFWDEILAEADEDDRLGIPIPNHIRP